MCCVYEKLLKILTVFFATYSTWLSWKCTRKKRLFFHLYFQSTEKTYFARQFTRNRFSIYFTKPSFTLRSITNKVVFTQISTRILCQLLKKLKYRNSLSKHVFHKARFWRTCYIISQEILPRVAQHFSLLCIFSKKNIVVVV